MNIPWYLTALGAALIWGLHYPLVDFALRRISIYSVLLLTVLPVLLLMPVFMRDVSRDLDTLRTLPAAEQGMSAAIGVTSLLEAVLLYHDALPTHVPPAHLNPRGPGHTTEV